MAALPNPSNQDPKRQPSSTRWFNPNPGHPYPPQPNLLPFRTRCPSGDVTRFPEISHTLQHLPSGNLHLHSAAERPGNTGLLRS